MTIDLANEHPENLGDLDLVMVYGTLKGNVAHGSTEDLPGLTKKVEEEIRLRIQNTLNGVGERRAGRDLMEMRHKLSL